MAVVDVMEAIGAGPASEVATAEINLCGTDVHSTTSTLIVPNAGGSPTYSCERWLRLRFAAPFLLVRDIRFWIDNYLPAEGWELRYGTSEIYRNPVTSRSDVAQLAVPTTDPGRAAANVDAGPFTDAGQDAFSSWIVLQAMRVGDAPPLLQPNALHFRFAFLEA